MYYSSIPVVFIFVFLLINQFVCGLCTYYISNSKGREGGFGWGFWLGLLGILVVGFRGDKQVWGVFDDSESKDSTTNK